MSSIERSFLLLARLLVINSSQSEIQSLKEIIESHQVSWEEIISIANAELLTPLLWISLNKKGLLSIIPEELKAYLEEIYQLNLQRNRHLKAQLQSVIGILNNINVEPMVLKGSSYLLLDVFDSIAARIMYDIDLLVPEERLIQCVDALKTEKYETDPEVEKKKVNHHHWAPLFKPGEYAAIELHRDLLFHSAQALLQTKDAFKGAESKTEEFGRFKVLSPTHQMLHGILHSQIVDRYYERHILKLRAIVDIAYLCEFCGEDIDWYQIARVLGEHEQQKVLLAHVYTANKLLNMPIPEALKPGLSEKLYFQRCLWSLRWPWFRKLEDKLLRFSAYEICRTYHCRDDSLTLIKMRLYHVFRVATRFISGKAN